MRAFITVCCNIVRHERKEKHYLMVRVMEMMYCLCYPWITSLSFHQKPLHFFINKITICCGVIDAFEWWLKSFLFSYCFIQLHIQIVVFSVTSFFFFFTFFNFRPDRCKAVHKVPLTLSWLIMIANSLIDSYLENNIKVKENKH